jgi:hypothetical protein
MDEPLTTTSLEDLSYQWGRDMTCFEDVFEKGAELERKWQV